MENDSDNKEILVDQAWRAGEESKRFYEMTYAGATSFLRRKYTKELKDIDIAVSGVPFDSAVTNRPGCRLGPRAIRASSVELASLNSYPFGIDPFQHINVIDYGDCYLNTHKPESIEGSIYQHAKTIIESGTKMLTFGGDHFISLPLLRAHAEVYGPISLLQFDSHCDTWEPQGPIDHGTMFLTAVNEGLINVDNAPSWSTSAGTVATISDQATGNHATLAATDSDSDTIAYSETGATNITGAGLSLNSSTGAISGDPTNVNSSTTVSFDVRATAGSKTTDRAFTITVTHGAEGGGQFNP